MVYLLLLLLRCLVCFFPPVFAAVLACVLLFVSSNRIFSICNTRLLCGLTGWCMEILWTGLHSILSGELTMTGKTSLLMFPIYGCGAIIRPLSGKLSAVPLFVRGCIYTVGFFFVEFISGALLRCFHMCPWDYSNTPLNYRGLIRPDYAPLWFGAGLFFEKILGKLS